MYETKDTATPPDSYYRSLELILSGTVCLKISGFTDFLNGTRQSRLVVVSDVML